VLRRALALVALTAACSEAPPPRFEVALRVESDPGQPLAGARISSAGAVLGSSDERGALSLALAGTPGQVVNLTVTCPEGHRAPPEPLTVALRQLAQDGRRPEFRVRCQPLMRRLVVAVRTHNGADLPLRYLGREIARTDAAGAAHALLRVSPGETVTVSLDTREGDRALLLPANPQRTLTMPARDEIVLFDQAFSSPKKHRRRKVQLPSGPIRI
jgi:hypothetical protein